MATHLTMSNSRREKMIQKIRQLESELSSLGVKVVPEKFAGQTDEEIEMIGFALADQLNKRKRWLGVSGEGENKK